ncbi:MAG: hypothetical protein N4R07_07725, partial [Lactobacillus crispatus]|nr:hypothetical protein [Lactobacillus crispatus]
LKNQFARKNYLHKRFDSFAFSMMISSPLVCLIFFLLFLIIFKTPEPTVPNPSNAILMAI